MDLSRWSGYGADALALLISVGLLLTYHIYLKIKLRRDPGYTVQAINREARRAWVENIMANEPLAILAIQTLRNSTMASTFLASTSVLLIMGTLTLSGQYDKLKETWGVFNLVDSQYTGLWLAKLLFLVTVFFTAFFSFAMSLRLYNHVGYQIAVPMKMRSKEITPQNVAAHLNYAGKYFSIGMRSYYFAVPLVFWLFGPLFIISATVILIAVLYHVDRAPD